MSELVFLKLGGSLITDKAKPAVARPEVIHRLASEVRQALADRPDLRLLLGHGSGSYGHQVAAHYRVHQGCTDWWGYALTSAAAARLNRLVADIFLEEGVPVVSLQPSASAQCSGSRLVAMAINTIQGLLAHGLVPLVYGDVALDEVQGSAIISTEQILAFLAAPLKPTRIVLAGETAGVFTADPRQDPQARLIPEIAAQNLVVVEAGLSGSLAVDVTGGMRAKVHIMCDLVRQYPALTVRIVSGLEAGCVYHALLGVEKAGGTLLHA